MEHTIAKHSLRAFIIILAGQLISIVGTGLTNFAIGVWVYQRTGSVTKFALTILAITLPSILVSPLAGALVDRWNRRLTIILGDSVSALCSLFIALLLYLGQLAVWHICVIIAIAAIASVFHGLAFTATVPLIIPKEQLSRVSGVIQIGPAVAQIISPLLAGMMLAVMSIQAVILVDFTTFLFALFTTFIVRLPQPPATEEGEAAKGSLLREATYGWTYIKARPGLLWLLFFFTIVNFTMAMTNVLLTPMLLGLATVEVVGMVASVASFGMLAGSITLSIWGGPKRRIYGVLGFGLLLGLCTALMGLRPSPVLIAIAGFGYVFAVPFTEGCSQAIWLSKTPPDVQGRVLSMRMVVGWAAAPLAYVLAGPVADKVLEPLLAPDGMLAGSVGKVIGVGPGRGIGLLLILLGIFMLLATAVSFLNPRVRRVEEELPDAIPEMLSEEEKNDNLVDARTAATA